ncbi:MAG: lycopene cyclase family protein [Planctomycetota bacterium]
MTAPEHLVIVGGGCAGLSLAVKLVEGGLGNRRITVLDAREEYVRDRTWCGWSVRPHRFQSCVTQSWNAWSVRAQGDEVVQRSEEVRYEHIPSDLFYDECLSVLRASPSVELLTGVQVGEIEDRGKDVCIQTDQGPLEAARVVDTRPPRRQPALLQHFEGWHLSTKDDVFDPGQVTLMDFDVSQNQGLHFMYVLPFSPNEALVEATFISEETLDPKGYGASITRFLDERYGTEASEITWRERGAIPMSAGRVAMQPSPRVIRAGGAAGSIKPSTGYAFASIQEQTDLLAEILLGKNTGRVPAPRSVTSDAMDRIFLKFLNLSPERAPVAFRELFRRVPAEPLARFLMECGRPTDRLRVITAMPKLPFLRAAASVL